MSVPSALVRDDDDRGPGRDGLARGAARTWPPGVSRAPSMRISDVLRALHDEFPSISHSKLRFLEEQGLVEPVRTASGYRQYSPADVERLRFVLVEQRDRYLPLKVIKERLAELDASTGEVAATRAAEPAEPEYAPRAAGDADSRPSARTHRPRLATVADDPGVDHRLVEELVSAGVLRPGPGGRLDGAATEILRAAAALGRFGIEPRHLRSLRTAVDRQVALTAQVAAPLRSQQSASAHARAAATAQEVGDLFTDLHAAWLRQGLADLT